MSFVDWPNSVQIPISYLTICITIPSMALYIAEIVTIIRHKMFYNSFYDLFVMRAIPGPKRLEALGLLGHPPESFSALRRRRQLMGIVANGMSSKFFVSFSRSQSSEYFDFHLCPSELLCFAIQNCCHVAEIELLLLL
ncbi:hypothetical protein GPALN_013310 [Globodera pallida]|nr:hypothetical protein GPALN_013310 [Globodera pallida]